MKHRFHVYSRGLRSGRIGEQEPKYQTSSPEFILPGRFSWMGDLFRCLVVDELSYVDDHRFAILVGLQAHGKWGENIDRHSIEASLI